MAESYKACDRCNVCSLSSETAVIRLPGGINLRLCLQCRTDWDGVCCGIPAYALYLASQALLCNAVDQETAVSHATAALGYLSELRGYALAWSEEKTASDRTEPDCLDVESKGG